MRMSIFFGVCLLGIGYIYRLIFFARAVHVVCDDMIDQVYCAALQEQLTVSMVNYPKTCAASIHAQYPFVDAITFSFLSDYTALVEICARRPILQINTTHIVMENYDIISADVYKIQYKAMLPRMQVTDVGALTASIAKKMCSCVDHVDDAILEQYDLQWHDETDVWLIKKTDTSVAFRIHADFVCTQQELAQGQQVLQLVREEREKTKKKKALWVADMRFEKQIVAYTR